MKDLIEALQILQKYDEKKFPTNCSHDYFYVDVDPELVSEADKKRLEELSFKPDEDLGGFGSFRFGSC